MSSLTTPSLDDPQARLAPPSGGEPTFSIVMPVYNRAHLVGRAIESVLGQTFRDFELLVVDDASTDDTESVVRAFDDERIVYHKCPTNVGNAAARNVALRRARGTYVTFLDSDDEYLPGFLAEMHALLGGAAPEVGFAWVGRLTVLEDDGGETVTPTTPWAPGDVDDPYVEALLSLRGGIPYGLTLRRACLDRVGLFDTELASAVDTDFVLRLTEHYPYVYDTTPLIRYHVHRGPRVSTNVAKKARSYERIIGKHLPNLTAHPRVQAALLYKVGWLYYASGDRARGRHYTLRAIRREPRLLKAWAALLVYELFGPAAPRVHALLSGILKTAR